MGIEFLARDSKSIMNSIDIKKEVDECPLCHSKISPVKLAGYFEIENKDEDSFLGEDGYLYIMNKCPNSTCNDVFFTKYFIYDDETPFETSYEAYYENSYPEKYENIEFEDIIKDISPDFIKIYNQAVQAEVLKLDDVCGVAYRKALEFLIKDYCIKNNPEKEDEIKKKFLSNCIKDYIDDSRIKKCSELAVWLGNDETHYIRKWEDKDVKDLKNLIHLTVHWISMENLTNEYLADMQG